MRSRNLRITWIILLGAVCVIALVTILNYRPPLVQLDSGPAGRIEAYYFEYAGGGSCKWRSDDGFHQALLLALLAYPAVLFAAARFSVALLSSTALAEERREPAVGLAVSALLLLWLLRLGFVSAALELC